MRLNGRALPSTFTLHTSHFTLQVRGVRLNGRTLPSRSFRRVNLAGDLPAVEIRVRWAGVHFARGQEVLPSHPEVLPSHPSGVDETRGERVTKRAGVTASSDELGSKWAGAPRDETRGGDELGSKWAGAPRDETRGGDELGSKWAGAFRVPRAVMAQLLARNASYNLTYDLDPRGNDKSVSKQASK